MDKKLEFVTFAVQEGANIRELCRRFNVSRTTGYKWLDRYEAGGRVEAALVEHSRRPKTSPRRSTDTVEADVLEIRRQHPAWGGRKITKVLERKGKTAPAPSTVTNILRRHDIELGAFGGGKPALQRFERPAPNQLWQMDFKGHIAMACGARVHPFTVLDDHSRFSIALVACTNESGQPVREALIAAFRLYGLPDCILCDNGGPWGRPDETPFTALTVFLMEQGIRVSHARPYHPQTVGKDERFHRSLKAEALRDTFTDLAAAQKTFDAWRKVYNHERPHEGIGNAVPADRYSPSRRAYVPDPPPFEYGLDDKVRRVQKEGWISYRNKYFRLSKALRGKPVALRPTATDGKFEVFFRQFKIQDLDLTKKA